MSGSTGLVFAALSVSRLTGFGACLRAQVVVAGPRPTSAESVGFRGSGFTQALGGSEN